MEDESIEEWLRFPVTVRGTAVILHRLLRAEGFLIRRRVPNCYANNVICVACGSTYDLDGVSALFNSSRGQRLKARLERPSERFLANLRICRVARVAIHDLDHFRGPNMVCLPV